MRFVHITKPLHFENCVYAHGGGAQPGNNKPIITYTVKLAQQLSHIASYSYLALASIVTWGSRYEPIRTYYGSREPAELAMRLC